MGEYKALVYPLAPNEQAEMDTFIEENLQSGHICLSKFPMALPVFFIKKKDGSLWLVTGLLRFEHTHNKKSLPTTPLISELVN